MNGEAILKPMTKLALTVWLMKSEKSPSGKGQTDRKQSVTVDDRGKHQMMQVGDEYDGQGNDAQERFQDDALCLERRVENLGVGKADGLSGKVTDETKRGIERLHEQSHEHAAGNFEQCQLQKVKKISRRRRQKTLRNGTSTTVIARAIVSRWRSVT